MGVFAIETFEMIEGDLPFRARKLVAEWAHMYRDELRTMWENQEFRVLPGLDA